jgi:hypothetical protein
LVKLIIKPGGPEAGSKMALLDKELEVFTDKTGRMDLIIDSNVSNATHGHHEKPINTG